MEAARSAAPDGAVAGAMKGKEEAVDEVAGTFPSPRAALPKVLGSSAPPAPGATLSTPVRVAVAEPSSPASEAPSSPATPAVVSQTSRAAAAVAVTSSTATSAATSTATATAARPEMSPTPPSRPIASATRPGSLRKVAEPVGGLTPVAGSTGVDEPATKASVRPASVTRSKRPPSAERPHSALTCPICLETVAEGEGRSTAALACGHKFHLSCIGSAFNAKGAMVCPLCRREEDDEWRYADGLRAEDDWDPADLGEADAALFYPSDDEYDDEQDVDAEYWCEELPVLWRIHAAPVRYTDDLTDEDEDEDEYEDEDEDADELDDDASIDEDFHSHYVDEDGGAQRQVYLRGRPMMMHQYVELSHVYNDRVAEDDEIDDDSATAPQSTVRTGSSSDATPPAAAATSGAETMAQISDNADADPIPEDEVSDHALDAASEDTRTRVGATSGLSAASTRTVGGTGAPSLRLRPRHVLHFGRVLSYGGQPRWSDLTFDGVDGIGLPPARYCYVANLELGLLPAER